MRQYKYDNSLPESRVRQPNFQLFKLYMRVLIKMQNILSVKIVGYGNI